MSEIKPLPIVFVDGVKAAQSAVNYVADQAGVTPSEALNALTAAAQRQQQAIGVQNATKAAINECTVSLFAVPVFPDFEAKPSSGNQFVAGVIASLE